MTDTPPKPKRGVRRQIIRWIGVSTALGCALLAYLNVQGHQGRLAWVRAVEKAGLTARLDYNIWLVGLPSWLQPPFVQRLLAREIAIVEVNGQDDLTKLINCKKSVRRSHLRLYRLQRHSCTVGGPERRHSREPSRGKRPAPSRHTTGKVIGGVVSCRSQSC
jgi:hypothetical protein